MAQLADAFHQKTFVIKLLNVDKRRLLAERKMILLLQVKTVNFIITCKRAAHAPLHAFGRNAVVNAQLVKNLQ